jgi:hypothetical protein
MFTGVRIFCQLECSSSVARQTFHHTMSMSKTIVYASQGLVVIIVHGAHRPRQG